MKNNLLIRPYGNAKKEAAPVMIRHGVFLRRYINEKRKEGYPSLLIL